MYNITWDKETGGVLLNSRVMPGTLGVSPRPVFWEELDLLKLNELGWSYPHCEEPLLWACNKQYFYRGEMVFEAKGANLYDNATILFQSNAENLTLEPIDVKMMLHKNKDEMFLVESEAIEFIRDTYTMYASAKTSVDNIDANKLDFEEIAKQQEKRTKQRMAIVKEDCDSFDVMPLEKAQKQGKRNYLTTKIDKFLASFSGGKDSQVVLDLCTRAIPSTAFEVIYSDTGYELPPSLELYKSVQVHYKKRFPDLKFSLTKNHESVLNYWDKIGTPSDTHRWCCSVMKTAPLYKSLKIEGTNKQAKVLTFDGVRAEESTRRSNYNRIGKGVKHATVINASPILNWNSVEIFLYLFKYNFHVNPAYRQGMTRVGCLICPFSSEWNDMVSNNYYKKEVFPFVDRIEDIAKKSNIKDIYDYIKSGNWKRRAGGRDIQFPSYMEIESTKPHLKIRCINPQKDILTWLNAACEFNISSDCQTGELRYNKKIFSFNITTEGLNKTIVFENTYSEPLLQGLLKKVFYKSTYCINCETCEVECPTGALTILPEAKIDESKCIRCHKCLNFHGHGCIVADSLTITGNNNMPNKMKLISYNNFGLNEDWLSFFFTSPQTYFTDHNHGLNEKEQIPPFIKWLVQAEIIDSPKTKSLTPLGLKLSELYIDMPEIVWEIIWINLSYNSPIALWYKQNILWNSEFSDAEIKELVMSDYPSDSQTSIKNIVYALFRTFRESPIGKMGICIEEGKTRYKKVACGDTSREAIAYSLYKYAESKGVRSFRVSDLYSNDSTEGVYKEFGLLRNDLESNLRSLNSESNSILVAELNMGLDHVTLREDLSTIDVLNILL